MNENSCSEHVALGNMHFASRFLPSLDRTFNYKRFLVSYPLSHDVDP
jgi:hypothetical protein